MKNLFFVLAFMLMGTSFATNTVEKTSTFEVDEVLELTNVVEISYEYQTIFDTCYVRVCWNETETTRRCTDWQEVPCDTELELEGKIE